jgi:hypothetical protein
VLKETLKHGLAPNRLFASHCRWDPLNGVSGQAFMDRTQISNVYELEILTG